MSHPLAWCYPKVVIAVLNVKGLHELTLNDRVKIKDLIELFKQCSALRKFTYQTWEKVQGTDIRVLAAALESARDGGAPLLDTLTSEFHSSAFDEIGTRFPELQSLTCESLVLEGFEHRIGFVASMPPMDRLSSLEIKFGRPYQNEDDATQPRLESFLGLVYAAAPNLTALSLKLKRKVITKSERSQGVTESPISDLSRIMRSAELPKLRIISMQDMYSSPDALKSFPALETATVICARWFKPAVSIADQVAAAAEPGWAVAAAGASIDGEFGFKLERVWLD